MVLRKKDETHCSVGYYRHPFSAMGRVRVNAKMIGGNKEELKKPTAAGIVKTLTSDELSMMRDMHSTSVLLSSSEANEVEARTFTNDEILNALDGLSEKKKGMGRLMIYLAFVFVFYMVLILQKAPEDVFEVQDVVQESINGLEWSHGNTWQVRIGSTRCPRAHELVAFSCSSLSPPTHPHVTLPTCTLADAPFAVCIPLRLFGQSSTNVGTGDPLRPLRISPPPFPFTLPRTRSRNWTTWAGSRRPTLSTTSGRLRSRLPS